MARIDALSIMENGQKDKLAEIYGQVIESIQRGCLSERYKNTAYSGDATSGTVEISRFSNATIKDYGTARSGSKGEKLDNSGKVVISVDVDKEIVEEFEQKDLKLHPVSDLVARRKNNHAMMLSTDLDRAFFGCAEDEGTEVTGLEGEIHEKLDTLINNLCETKNKWVDGLDRSQLVIFLNPATYSLMRNYLDKVTNPNVDSAQQYVTMFRSVIVEENIRQEADVICMIQGAVGQLITSDVYEVEKVPFSNAFAASLFYSRGTKAVMPDLIKKVTDINATVEG